MNIHYKLYFFLLCHKKIYFLDEKNFFQGPIMKKWPELYNFGVFAAWVHPVAQQHDNNFFFRVYP
jgi:hypothetical protein